MDKKLNPKSKSTNEISTKNNSKTPDSKHLAYIKGPILFTAPHSSRVYRGGVDYGTKEIIHSRERFTSVLAIRWACQSGNSFCVWSKENKLNRNDVDPNYMQDNKKQFSPFHQSLHALQLKNKDTPIMHVDIHGKMNRKTNFDLDLGIAPLLVKWENIEQEFCLSFCKILTDNLNKSLELAKPFKGFTAICNNQPNLNGYWGCDNLYTMTEQAVDLGIPSLQLEIPLEMRYQLYINRAFSDAFLKAITDSFETLIKVWWPKRKIKQTCNLEISSKLIEINEIKSKNNCENLVKEYEKWESTPPLNDKTI